MTENQQWHNIYTLIKLAEMGAHKRTTKISTQLLAQKLQTSQQTASRHLIELENKGYIKRTPTHQGSLIKIQPTGTKELQKLNANLKLLLETNPTPTITIEGTVFTGLGEGAYYVTKPTYKKQFTQKLGFTPYPGTLNLKLTAENDVKTRTELEAYPNIQIQGFKNTNRAFGAVKCYPITINNQTKGALITAHRTHYDATVLEVIAPVCLRKHLNLKDGDKVKIELLPPT